VQPERWCRVLPRLYSLEVESRRCSGPCTGSRLRPSTLPARRPLASWRRNRRLARCETARPRWSVCGPSLFPVHNIILVGMHVSTPFKTSPLHKLHLFLATLISYHVEASSAKERPRVTRVRSHKVCRGHNHSDGGASAHFVQIHARIEVCSHPGVYDGEALLQSSL